MKLIKRRKLAFQEGNSDKVYEVDLCEAGEGEFIVNLRYGRRGTTLRDGTKTAFPVEEEVAEKMFDKLVNAKLNKGYRDVGDEAGAPAEQSEEPAESASDKAVAVPGNPQQRSKTLAHLAEAAERGVVPKKWKLSRVLWRAGELRLREALPHLVKLVDSVADAGSPMDRYCLAWALGNCAGESIADATAALAKLAEGAARAKEETTQRMVWEGMRAVDSSSVAEVSAATLPDAVRSALRGEATSLLDAVRSEIESKRPPYNFLHHLYLLADQHPQAREVVSEVIKAAPMKPPLFKHMRHLFKAAEFRLDAEFYGMLAHRFENTTANYRPNSWGGNVYFPETNEVINADEEVKKSDSRLGYPARTRTYLRKRIIHRLRRAGEDEDVEAFITLATGVLLAYHDGRDRHALDHEVRFSYGRTVDGRWETTTHRRNFDDFAKYASLNFLLYENSPRYEATASLRWACKDDYEPGQPAPTQREEAFPKLWDRAPDALMHLLSFSECERVVDFAVKVWRANEKFDSLPDVAFIAQLLRRPYETANALGLDLARARFDAANPDTELLGALVGSPHAPARELGLEFLTQCQAVLTSDAEFCASLIVSRFEDVQTAVRQLLSTATWTDAQLEDLVPLVVGAVLGLSVDDEAAPSMARNGRETLLLIAPKKLAEINPEVVTSLLGHGLEDVQLLGAQIALQFEDKIEALSDSVLQTLLLSDHASVRTIGMRLFGKLPDAALLERSEILTSFCISQKADVRQAAQPIVRRLAAQNREFAEEMVTRFYPLVLRQESHEGVHEDVYTLLEGPLGEHLSVIPVEHSLRMVESKYSAGQKLGFLLIEKFVDLRELPMRQTAKLGGLELLKLREHVQAFYRSNADFIKANKEDALRILDNDWQDAREASFEFFREHFSDEDWTPALLVSNCDSVRVDVQAFGRELITKFFANEDGPEYLMKLSQHPSAELQTFATNYLERFAGGEADRIAELELFFVTVLSQVNRGRVAKDRILHFLREEALKDREVAALVLRVLKRQSVTIAIGDKAACIETLLDIQNAWPDLAEQSPLVRVDYETCEIS